MHVWGGGKMKIAITATPSASRFAPIVLRGDVGEAFTVASRLGYDGVELHLRYPGDADAGTIKDLMKRYDLGVPTLGTGMAAGQDGLTFASVDAEIRRQAMDRIAGHIALAAQIGAGVTIGLIWGRVGVDEAQRSERLALAKDCLAQCARLAEKHGVTLFLEALNRYESDYPVTLEQAAAIVTEMGLTNVRLLADTYHMNIEEADMCASLRHVAPLLGHIHLVDSNRQAPGRGHCDLRSVVQTLSEIGFAGYLSFEVLALPSPLEAAVSGLAAVRSYGIASVQRG